VQLTGAGVQGDGTLESNEEGLVTFTDNVFIDQLRHAVRSAGKMSEQRVTFEVREEARMGLQDWWADRLDTSFFNQLCGNTAQSDTRYTGNQVAIAPDTAHKKFVNSERTTDASISTTSLFSLCRFWTRRWKRRLPPLPSFARSSTRARTCTSRSFTRSR
jgi:N4-gp56 family major capsid protein